MKKVFFDIVKEVFEPRAMHEKLDSSEGPAKEFNIKLKTFLETIYIRNIKLLKAIKEETSKKSDEKSTELNFPEKLNVSMLEDGTFCYLKDKIKSIFERYGFYEINSWLPSPKTNIDGQKLYSFKDDETEQRLHLQFIIEIRLLLFKIVRMENPNDIDINYYKAISQIISIYEQYYQKIRQKIIENTQRLDIGDEINEEDFFGMYLRLSLKADADLFPKNNDLHYLEFDRIKAEIYYACAKEYKENTNQNITELIQRVTAKKREYFNKWSMEEEYNE